MSVIDDLMLRVRRGDTMATRTVKDVYRWAMRFNIPDSRLTRPVFGSLYRLHDLYEVAREYTAGKLLYEPMARARFHQVGRGLQLSALPYVKGHARVTIGDNCRFGYFSVSSGRFVDEPELMIGNDVTVGSFVRFIVNKRIRLGNNVGIAAQCWLSDSDAHPSDIERREAGEDLAEGDIKPLTVEDFAWIGHGCHVLKGVTLGRGSVVAAGSVVVSDVPPGGLAMGVPARVLKRPW
jgi:acetyltransferase-like isoleucine patch superfamily enzyme